MILALLLAASGPGSSMSGDFDRDGRFDRVFITKRGDKYNIMMSRTLFSDIVPVQVNVEIHDDFTFQKVNKKDRQRACINASLPHYACDSGDVLSFGSGTDRTIAIWNGSQFVLYPQDQSN